MAEENTTELEQAEGQAAEGSETTTQVDSEGQVEQSVDTGATDTGHQEETVFDPAEFDRLTKDLPPELQAQATALQKSLQSGYTKKFQSVSEQRKKIDAYDAFSADPVTQMQAMAKQMGYSMTRGEAQQQVNNEDWEPQSWQEVFTKAEEGIMNRLSPVLSEVQNIKKNSIEKICKRPY